MAMQNYISQPAGVGIQRVLVTRECEHIICVLRAVERLHLLSELCPGESYVELQRRLSCIHRNHLDIKALVSELLANKGESIG